MPTEKLSLLLFLATLLLFLNPTTSYECYNPINIGAPDLKTYAYDIEDLDEAFESKKLDKWIAALQDIKDKAGAAPRLKEHYFSVLVKYGKAEQLFALYDMAKPDPDNSAMFARPDKPVPFKPKKKPNLLGMIKRVAKKALRMFKPAGRLRRKRRLMAGKKVKEEKKERKEVRREGGGRNGRSAKSSGEPVKYVRFDLV